MCEEETGITCDENAPEIAKEQQLQLTGRLFNPLRPIPGGDGDADAAKSRLGGP